MTITDQQLNYILLGVSMLLMLLDRAGYKLPILSALIHQVASLLGGVKMPALPAPAPTPGPVPSVPPTDLRALLANIDLNNPEVQAVLKELLRK